MESTTETGIDIITSPDEGNSSSLTFDAKVLAMIEMAEKSVVVLASHLNDSCEGQIDRERAKIVSLALLSIVSFVKSANTKQKVAFVKELLSKAFIIEVLGAYFMQHWTDLNACFDPSCAELCKLSSYLLTTVSDLSNAAKTRLVELGLITSLLQALNIFKESSFNDELQHRVLSSLILLSNCSKQALEYHEFDNATKCMKILAPYLKSTNSSIRMTTHGIAVNLGMFLSEDKLNELALSPIEINELIKALRLALGRPDLTTDVFGIRISAREILSELDLSMVVSSNVALLLKSDILNFIPSMLKFHDEDTMEAAISFIWTIAIATCNNTEINEPSSDFQQQLSLASPILKQLSTNKAAFSKLAECALLSLQLELLTTDVDSALKYIKGCYHYSRFHECQRAADAISKEPSALFYKAKCLFKLYRRALNLYEHENLRQQNAQKYLSILKSAKGVVSMLSTAMKKDCIDEEGKEQLDIAMMNVIRGINELNKVIHPRCMLCLCSDVKLQKSHVYPKSMLKEFSDSIEEREGGKLFTMINTSGLSPKWMYHYSSPKDVRYFMLCSQCEDVVNRGGEIDFLQSFFLQIYNKSEPSRVMEQTTVTYGPWLYHFCNSLVFRCIASGTGIPELVNKHEIYQLFLACREFLVSGKPSETKFYLFINPVQVPPKYEHSCLREVLNAPGFFSIQTTDLSDGVLTKPLKAHFAIAHCGIINIIVKFSPAVDVTVPSNWEVNPQGGEFIIPAEKDREKDIPEGVWSVFQQVSKSCHRHIIESLFRKKDKPPEVKASQNFYNPQCPHQEAWSERDILTSEYLEMNMLPSGFEINYFSGAVILPQGFIVLTHHTFFSSDEAEITLLVGAIESANETVPFVIFCRFISLGGFFVGFSVKFENDAYQLSNLCETDPEKQPEEVQQGVKDAEKFINDSLPSALTKKGFANLQSLVYNHVYNTSISSMDMKCPAVSRCWYCKDLCENCLSPSSFGPGLTAQSKTGISLKFCSQECALYFTEERPMVIDIELFPPREHHDSTPNVLLQITASGMLKMDEGVKITSLICHGYHSERYPNGRFFILCQLHSLFSQKFIEMFVSDKAVPEEPLPHADCPSGHKMVASSKNSGNITQIVISAFQELAQKCKEDVEFNLSNLTKFQSCLFKDNEAVMSIKLNACKMAVQQPLPSVDIHDLIQKLTELKNTLLSQRKVDVELSHAITILLTGLHKVLPQFSKEKDELLRLLHCCYDFLSEVIRGLQHCNDEISLTRAKNLLTDVWKACSATMVYTDCPESSRRSMDEFVSTLLDNIVKTTDGSKGESVHQIILLRLLYCCSKDENFRQFIGCDNLSSLLQPLLSKHASGACFLALLSLSFFINDDSPEQQKELLKLEKLDIQLLKVHLALKIITPADALQFLKTSTIVSANVAVLQSSDVQTFVSEFLDDCATEEGKLAKEIITILQSVPKKSTIDMVHELLESLLPLLCACNTATPDSRLDTETCIQISQKLQSLEELLGTDMKQLLQSISKTMLGTTARELSLYIKLHLMDVSGCINPKCPQILHSCGTLLIDICRYTSFSEIVVNEGLIGQLLTALKKFKEHEFSNDILARIVLCLVLLHLCSSETIKQHAFDNPHLVVSILLDYFQTSYLVIWMYSKVNMMHLGDLLDNEVLQVLELTEEALAEFVSKLSETVEDPSLLVKVFGGPMTANEIITFLAEATLLEKNSVRMLNVGLLECFPVLLQNHKTQAEAAKLLWTLTQRPAIRERVDQEAPLLYQIVEESSLHVTSDMLELLLVSLKGPTNADFPNLLKYARGCYSHNMLTECAASCEHLLSHELTPVDIKDASRVLLAKCNYRQYRKIQRLLSMRAYVDPVYIDQHKSCYELAEKVVKFLKLASKKGNGDLDEESLKCLDISLMDISREGNENVKKYRYCLLCKRSNSEIQHSHVLPKAILECFTASMGQTVGKKAFKAINFPMKKRFRYFTSKELAFYTFCKHCEKIFNDEGEKGFLNFFKEIYNSEDTDTLKKEHKLEYGPWLYHFCVSFIFRGIATSTGIPDYMESSEVYQCFLKCRKFLMGDYTLDSPELPQILLLFNPTTVPQEYKLQVLNCVLIAPGFFFCDSVSLANGSIVEPPVAQFMVAHIGIMNMLVVFSKDKSESVLDKHKVLPFGGTCIVPHDSERVLPKGMWKMFSSLSADYRRETQESFFHKKDKVPIHIQTVETEAEMIKQEAFKIMSASLKDRHLFADQCEQKSPVILNLLPETFIIAKESSVVSLPPDHHFLLHFHKFDENEQGSTALIGLFTKKGQPVKPFVIHYQFNLTHGFCVGFYLSESGEVKDLICDTSPEEESVRILVERVQKSIPIALPVILNVKGFVNMQSLIYHFQHSTFTCPLDTKCSSHQRCWYCRDRCENCLKRATILTQQPIIVSGLPLKFCGEECKAVFHGPDKPVTVLALPTRRSHSDTEKIEEGHSEICCIAGDGITDGEGFRFKISVRVGYKSTSNTQGRYYCIWNLRTLFKQQFAELFLHRDTSPDAPLPHINCPKGYELVQKLRHEDVLQSSIQAGFRVVKKQQQLGLPPHLAQVMVTEEIPAVSVNSLVSQQQQLHSSPFHVEENDIDQSSSTPDVAQLSGIEEGYVYLRQLVPDLPSINSLKTFKLEDVYGTTVQCWRKFICGNKSTLESDTFKILNVSIAFLLQVTEDIQVPVVIDVVLSILCKCLQSKVHQESIEFSLIQGAVKTALSQQNCQRRIFAMMALSNYLDRDEENVVEYIKLTKEDVKAIDTLVKCKEETEDILLFLDQVRAVECNSYILCSCGGLDILSKVIDITEIEKDTEKAALLLEALLSEKK